MGITEDYKLSIYQDYGPLGEKPHIHLVRNKNTGEICIKKQLTSEQKDIIDFRKKNSSVWFPKLLDIIKEETGYTIIEEYVEGITLDNYMMGEPLPPQAAVRFISQICTALSILHNSKPMIIYRDLKPENIMITSSDNIKLIDFNISRPYQKGKRRDTELLGTIGYAAPEQFGYLQTDNRTDIYALGVLFNYMLTAKLPAEKIAEGKYTPIIEKCIEMAPDKRYQNVEEFLHEINPKYTASKEATNHRTSHHSSWAIPGFRTKTPWKIIFSTLGYCYIFYIGITIEFFKSDGTAYTPFSLWLSRILLTLSQIATVFFSANYCGISEKIKIYRHPRLIVRLLAYTLTWFFFLCIAGVAASIIEGIFGG